MSGPGGRKKTSWKSEWHHGKTKIVRVPEALVEQIIEYARALDAGLVPHISHEQLQKATLLAIDQFVEERLEQFHPNQYKRSGNTETRRWDELRKFRQHIADGVQYRAPNFKKSHAQ
ncbi:MAG: hypothetical protein DSM106950_01350 [Stigonema ocellatum SAG 48.90 = DSM 106950]|nr:hypothetical protein [Stigonema ocellatum SAG 48.90 = DSM 106950]